MSDKTRAGSGVVCAYPGCLEPRAPAAAVHKPYEGKWADSAICHPYQPATPLTTAVAEAARAYIHGTYPDGRPYKGGDLTNAVKAWEEAA